MSEFLAEASVLIRPDTTKFRAQLEAELTAIIATAKLPPVVVPVAAVAAAETTGVARTAAATAAAEASAANATALTEQTAATTAATAATEKLIPLEVVDADVARSAGAAHAEAAAATVVHARQLSTLERGAAASSLSLLGVRGATLAASGAFLAGAASVIVLSKSIAEASALNEEINKSKVVFKESASAIVDWSKTTATSLGVAQVAALRAAGQFGNILVPLGVLPEKAAIFSQQLVQLASDMASFNNVSPERTLTAIQSGLVGQSRPLRVFGVQLTAARVAQEALRETGKKQATELTQQEKVLARYTLILQDSAIQQGDFARTQDRLANQSRILRAQLADLGGTIGTSLTPAVTDEVRGLNIVIGALGRAGHAVGSFGGELSALGVHTTKASHDFGSFLKEASKLVVLGPLAVLADQFGTKAEKVSLNLGQLTKQLTAIGNESRKVAGPAGIVAISDQIDHLIGLLNEGGPKGRQFAQALAQVLSDIQRTGKIPVNLGLVFQTANIQIQAQEALDKIVHELNTFFGSHPIQPIPVKVTLQTQLAVAEATGTQDEQLRILRQQQEAQQKHLQQQLAQPQTAGRQKAVQNAAVALKQTNAAIQSILDKQASDAKSAADKAKTAAEKLKTAQDAANQAFLDAFAPKEQARQNAIVSAGLTARLSDDIKANRALIRFERDEINAIRDRISRLNLHGDRLKAAVAAIRAAQQKIFDASNAIFGLEKQRADARKAALQAATDARQSHLEALLSIAETTTRTTDDQRALKALIRFDDIQIKRLEALKKRRKLTQEEAAQLDAYRVDVAQRNKALRDLTDEQKKGATIQQAEFRFLQTQQGFAANLIGNLIPLGAGGLVGGSTAAPVTPSAKIPTGAGQTAAEMAAANIQRRGVSDLAVAAGQREATRTRGFTAGQGERQINVLQRILQELKFINQGRDHPEAHHQRRVNSARQDTAIMTHGM